jgi:hypothetical protein
MYGSHSARHRPGRSLRVHRLPQAHRSPGRGAGAAALRRAELASVRAAARPPLSCHLSELEKEDAGAAYPALKVNLTFESAACGEPGACSRWRCATRACVLPGAARQGAPPHAIPVLNP